VEGVRHADDEGAVLAGERGSHSASRTRGTPPPLARATARNQGASPALTPVLTRDSMMRSLRARVSPCFILMRFLSRHFMAYLGARSPCCCHLPPVPPPRLRQPRPRHRVPPPPAPTATSPHPATTHGHDVPASPRDPSPWQYFCNPPSSRKHHGGHPWDHRHRPGAPPPPIARSLRPPVTEHPPATEHPPLTFCQCPLSGSRRLPRNRRGR